MVFDDYDDYIEIYINTDNILCIIKMYKVFKS